MKNKKWLLLLTASCMALSLCACGEPADEAVTPSPDVEPATAQVTNEASPAADTAEPVSDEGKDDAGGQPGDLQLQIGEHVLIAAWADNSSAEALQELLADGPLTIEMRDYGSMEKVGPIGQSLPTNNEQITTSAGDLILYQGSNLVIYYARNSWDFTRLGRIDDPSGLREALGSGNVSVTISL